MDILSARKKAAEQARKKAASEPAPKQEQPAAMEPSAGTAPTDDVTQPAEPLAPAAEGAADGQPPVSSEEETTEAAPVHEIEMLSFRLGVEHYAVEVDAVKEVLKNRDLTDVPNAPEYVLGVMALRGTVLPIIDLSRRLGLPPGINDEKTRIIVVSVNDEDAGIRVDRVTGVVRISPDAMRPAPETIEHGAEFLRGIARKDDRLYILLDIEKATGA